MPTVDVVDFNNQKVGSVDLADEVFGAEVNERLAVRSGAAIPGGQARAARTRPKPAAK